MADQVERLKQALVDRYMIERELGAGGMATVYLAEDLKHHRRVAIKVLDPDLARSLGAERFVREVEITANLNHPHILPLLDSGEAGGFLLYVMPYVEGETLRERMDREGQLPLDDALRIAREVAAALSYAHSQGVIHRDIKPENVLLSAGEAVVADFGIAKAITEAGGESLTQTGISIGTPAYMSPEQASGDQKLDGRSDVYSLGCVLYEMLAGEPPYTGPTAQAIAAKKLSQPVPRVSVVRETVPSTVEAAISRALARAPADRFVTAVQFVEALSAERVTAVSPPRRATRTVRRRIALLGAAALLVVATVVVLSRSLRPGLGAARNPRTAIAVLPFQNLSAEGPNAYFAGALHDELLTQLAKVAALKPISRTSVMGYAGTTKPMKEIARELGVGAIVEGSVQVAGERLRVNVRLIDPAIEEHLWVNRYDETLDDAMRIQSDIAQQVVIAVGTALTEREVSAIAAVPTENPEAYRFYLQAKDYANRPGLLQENLEITQELLEQALRLDPAFALAHAARSMLQGIMYWFAYDPSPARLESQRAEAEAALSLAPELPAAREAMVYVRYYGELDYAGALEEATRAVEVLPGSATLWSTIGYLHRRLGHWDGVLAAYEKAAALDPRDPTRLAVMGGDTYRFLKRYEDAIREFDRALELAPDYHGARVRRAWTYVLWSGELDTLRAVLEHAPQSFGDYGSSDRWRARLALWERNPGVLLAVLGDPAQVTFEARLGYEPGLLFAGWAHRLRGDSVAASRAFAAALAQLDSVTRERPDDWRVTASRGLALAGVGRWEEARAECHSLERSPVYADLFTRPVIDEARAMILAQAGLVDEALAAVEPLIAGPSWTSAQMVRIDPRFDPIRDDPRFQALLEKYGN